MISISMISLCILVFRLAYLTAAVKLLLLQRSGRKYIPAKTANVWIFPTGNDKYFFQPLAALQDLDTVENRKHYALPP